MAYAHLSAAQLRQLLAERDEQLLQSEQRRQAEENQRNQRQIPVQPVVRITDPWDTKAHDMAASFQKFLLSWRVYSTALSVSSHPVATQVAIFWSALGIEGIQKCQTDWNFTDAHNASVDVIIASIHERLASQRVPMIDRVKFGECMRDLENAESITDYVKRAEKLVDYCNYGANRSDNLLQQVLRGMKEPKLQRELLTTPNLNWVLAKQKIEARRLCDNQLEVLNSIKTEPEEVKKIHTDYSKKKCKYCNLHHKFGKDSCPAYGKRCNFCNRYNHFEVACQQKARSEDSEDDSDDRSVRELKSKKKDSRKSKSKKKCKKIQYVSDSDSSSDNIPFYIRKVSAKSENEFLSKLNCKLNGDWKQVECQLDTGSNCNIMGFRNLKRLVTDPVILPCNVKMLDVQKNRINSLGETRIRCRRNNREYVLIFQVVEFEQMPLLSANACKILKLFESAKEKKENSDNRKWEKQLKELESKVQKLEAAQKSKEDPKASEMSLNAKMSEMKASFEKTTKIMESKILSLEATLKKYHEDNHQQEAKLGPPLIHNGTPKDPRVKLEPHKTTAEGCSKDNQPDKRIKGEKEMTIKEIVIEPEVSNSHKSRKKRKSNKKRQAERAKEADVVGEVHQMRRPSVIQLSDTDCSQTDEESEAFVMWPSSSLYSALLID